jgi:hypothetical protein
LAKTLAISVYNSTTTQKTLLLSYFFIKANNTEVPIFSRLVIFNNGQFLPTSILRINFSVLLCLNSHLKIFSFSEIDVLRIKITKKLSIICNKPAALKSGQALVINTRQINRFQQQNMAISDRNKKRRKP